MKEVRIFFFFEQVEQIEIQKFELKKEREMWDTGRSVVFFVQVMNLLYI